MSTSPSPRTWSPYQEAVFAAILSGHGNIAVEAVAGSGKSTTIVEGFHRWSAANPGKNGIFLAFNRSIAEALAARVPQGVEARTMHSVCFRSVARAFRGIRVDDRKGDDHARQVLLQADPALNRNTSALRAAQAELLKAYSLLRATCTSLEDPEACELLLAQHELQFEFSHLWLPRLAAFRQAMNADTVRCNFDEMISFVVDHDLPMAKYDLVAIDEAQDTSVLQISVLPRLMKRDGRILVIGDSKQSLYRFRGADSSSMQRLRDTFKVEHNLPLSISYRCPRAVIEAAQAYVPHIEASPSAPQGEVIRRAGDKLDKTLTGLVPGSMVVCRCNAPLVGAAMKLLRQGRHVIVKGRDIGRGIIRLCEDARRALKPLDVQDLVRDLNIYVNPRLEKLILQGKDAQADSLQDRADTLMTILEDCATLDEVDQRCEQLFADVTPANAVVFSSSHKAKGLEAPIVTWLFPELNNYFLTKAKSEEAAQQEKNIIYVTITRAMQTLIIQAQPDREAA